MTTMTDTDTAKAGAYRLAQAHRLMRLLEEKGYVRKRGDGWYEPVGVASASDLNRLDLTSITEADGQVIPEPEDYRVTDLDATAAIASTLDILDDHNVTDAEFRSKVGDILGIWRTATH